MKKNAENQKKKSLLSQVRELNVGEQATFPISRASYIRSLCVTFGPEWDKKFTTRMDREAKTITAKRVL